MDSKLSKIIGKVLSTQEGMVYDAQKRMTTFVTARQLWEGSHIGSHRSDIEPPLAGWRGKLGINAERYEAISAGV